MRVDLSNTFKKLRNSRAVWNISASYFAFASTSLWAIVSIPIAVEFLSDKEIGLWAVVNAFIGYLMWMDGGISVAIGRLIAPAVAEGDQTEINRWWTASSLALWVQAGILLIVGMSVTPLTIIALGIEEEMKSTAFWLLLSGVLMSATNLPLRGVPSLSLIHI